MDISEVEAVAGRARNLSDTLENNVGIQGYVELSTCNRYELMFDAEPAAVHELAEQLGHVDVHEAMEAARHIYEVTSGLDSMVVGEREIVAQVRKALKSARRSGTTTKLLEHVLQGALRASRQVAVSTDFSTSGRSIVGAALDMALFRCRRNDDVGAAGAESVRAATAGQAPALISAEQLGTRDDKHPPILERSNWAGVPVLLVGTGAYAGATVSALHARGADDIQVWSKSGRAQAFAATHEIEPAQELDLLRPEVVILARGTGSPVITANALREAMGQRDRPLTLIDLARSRDVEPESKTILGVTLIDLETIRHHVPAAELGDMERAEQVVEQALAELEVDQIGREMDPVIVGMRRHIAQQLEEELQRLPATGDIPAEQAIRALQRFAAQLAYAQSETAREAARAGRAKEYHEAAELVYGTSLPAPSAPLLTKDF